MDQVSPPQVPLRGNFNTRFRRMAEKTSRFMGSPLVFFIALFLILVWGATGFYFNFNNTWQLIINTATTIGTFLIVILIQNTQNRDARSIQLKLDELLRGTKDSRDSFMEIEEESDEEIDALKKEFKKLREEYINHLKDEEKKKDSSSDSK